VTTQRPAAGARACTGGLPQGNERLAATLRKGLWGPDEVETPRRLVRLFGAAPKRDRIETLECREAASLHAARREGARRRKHPRGGLRPNGCAGRPRRGGRSGEQRPTGGTNRPPLGTDAPPEQGSEVVGSGLRGKLCRTFREANEPLRNTLHRPGRGRGRSPARAATSVEATRGLMPRRRRGRCRRSRRGRARGTGGRRRGRRRGEGGSRVRPRGSLASRNGKRAEGAERRHGWRSGKSSEDRNPRGGSGAKQSHATQAGENRREGEKPRGRKAPGR
jgi:hypothetical protein